MIPETADSGINSLQKSLFGEHSYRLNETETDDPKTIYDLFQDLSYPAVTSDYSILRQTLYETSVIRFPAREAWDGLIFREDPGIAGLEIDSEVSASIGNDTRYDRLTGIGGGTCTTLSFRRRGLC